MRWHIAVLAAAVAALTASCGGSQPPAEPPSVDVSGTWVGTIDSTDDRGNPVYGQYAATFNLFQTGANVTGSYRSETGSVGGLLSGRVSANRVTLAITARECSGTLQFTGTVREQAGSPAEMDVSYSGYTACTGERVDRGTLVRQ